MLGLADRKYLAQFGSNKEKQQQVITTGISIVICASAVISFLVIFFTQKLSKTIFYSNEFGIIFFIIWAIFNFLKVF